MTRRNPETADRASYNREWNAFVGNPTESSKGYDRNDDSVSLSVMRPNQKVTAVRK